MYIYDIWIKEGTWRLLSSHETHADALHVYSRLKSDGEKVKLIESGSAADRHMRSNVHDYSR